MLLSRAQLLCSLVRASSCTTALVFGAYTQDVRSCKTSTSMARKASLVLAGEGALSNESLHAWLHPIPDTKKTWRVCSPCMRLVECSSHSRLSTALHWLTYCSMCLAPFTKWYYQCRWLEPFCHCAHAYAIVLMFMPSCSCLYHYALQGHLHWHPGSPSSLRVIGLACCPVSRTQVHTP